MNSVLWPLFACGKSGKRVSVSAYLNASLPFADLFVAVVVVVIITAQLRFN